ncbi:putative ABC transport system permease protein [Bacteroides zoogleoformans]|uniref:ABC transporter substrate-binding protein n=1 Tax=Bacteroides zoogleoformans TaxID=28119 RepID=A0ABN5IGM8_9BACE|nr:ABC transporter permease [Bacteroides zoogleoformans]AVM51902.1 ABC transporter substrate-binding protein [Bacteroides zoogleoformans]TWJ17005.1 putative ABC transport system permease protein [Bacteroides zoogleoformans]
MKELHYVIQTLLRGRGTNIIKIVSLGLGLTMSILLFSRVVYEHSFDKCYRDYDNLYQVWSVFTANGEKYSPQEQNCGPVAGAILENFPGQVESATSIGYGFARDPLYNGTVRFDDGKVLADSLFFRTMGIEVFKGNPEKDLMQKDVIFLSDRLAKKIFGDENPIGKVLNYGHNYDLTVKGIYAAIPENATMNPEAVISMPSFWSRDLGNYSWSGGDSWMEYIRFRPGADKSVVNARIDAMIDKYRPAEDKKKFGYTAFVQPIRDTYVGYTEVKRMSNIMSILGLAILFIAALNYVLISISSLSYRAKAVGVHKCNGASGGKVFGMFLLETGIIILAALLLMALLLFNFREFFEDTASAKLSLLLLAPNRLWVPLSVVSVLFFVGGMLPGRLFSRIPVSQVFRRYTEGKRGWKRPLLFVQFAGVAFICGLMCVVVAQYRFVMTKDMGYSPERIAMGTAYWDEKDARDAAYQFFKDLPYVEALSSAHGTPIWGYSGSMIQDATGQALFSTRSSYYMREDYPELMGMTFKAGRMAREKDEVVVNETFAEMMHWGNEVVGRTVNMENGLYKVSGLLKEFQMQGFTSGKKPFIARGNKAFYGYIHLRLKEPFAENLRKLNKEASEAFPGQTIDFTDYSQMIKNRYNAVRVFRNATLLAAVTMFFIMLMGLTGYTADEVRRRSKEIAIRKVNGAEVSTVLELLSRDVLYVAGPAVLIGTIASWYVNGLWMEQFSEHIPLGWMVYALMMIVILTVIVGCVLWKSWKIANENPVNSIKSE